MMQHLLPSFETLQTPMAFDSKPTLRMIRSARFYNLTELDLPATDSLSCATIRELFNLFVENKAIAFVNDEDIFVTTKKILCPKKMKEVAVEDLFLQVKQDRVFNAIANCLLNEILPCVSSLVTDKWTIDFLVDLDIILSISIENNSVSKYNKNYNFRSLRHRIMTQKLKQFEIWKVEQCLSKYNNVIENFQTEKPDSIV